MSIVTIETPQEIASCFHVFKELRPHLTTQEAYTQQVLEQQKEGYRVLAIREENGDIAACLGYRIHTTLFSGRHMYIDDFRTREKSRRRGYGNRLMKHAIELARGMGLKKVELDSGYARHDAHLVYLQNKFILHCHHFQLSL